MDFTHAFARLDQVVQEQIRADNTPGMAVALTDRERLLQVRTYGFADAAARAAVTPDTLFEIGSIGKSFTADALLILAERGRSISTRPSRATSPGSRSARGSARSPCATC